MEIINVVILSLSSLLLLLVGATRLINPINAYSKNSGITLERNVNLLNEIRGVSSLMLIGGIIISLGVFFDNLTQISFVVATLIFLGFIVGRVLSVIVDGKPNQKIIQGIFFELVLGFANFFGLWTTFS